MTYTQLHEKLHNSLSKSLLTELESVLNNGFRKEVIKAVKEQVTPELKGVVMELHESALNTRDGTCSHYRDALRADFDRKIEGMEDRLGREVETMARIETVALTMSRDLKEMKEDHKIQDKRINRLEDQPGTKALASREKWKWIIIGALFGLPSTIYTVIRLINILIT